jgi:hypothetical protein
MKVIRLPLAAAGVLFLSAIPATAQYTWTGGGTDNNWTTVANWSGGVPVSGQNTTVAFAGTTRLIPAQNVADPFQLNALTFAAGAGSFRLTGSPLEFRATTGGVSPSLTQNSDTAARIDNNLVLTDDLTVGGAGTGS